MIHTDTRFHDAVERAVQEVEARTDAEVVVVAARASEPYRDLSMLVGAGFGLATLLAVLFADVVVHPIVAPLDVALGGVVGYGVARLTPVLRRLIPRSRRRSSALRAARAEFVGEAVYQTPGRIGILVYLSAVEGEVVVLPDVGVEGAVPGGELAAATRKLHASDVDGFVAGLKALGDVLAVHLPRSGDADRLELHDAPRIRS